MSRVKGSMQNRQGNKSSDWDRIMPSGSNRGCFNPFDLSDSDMSVEVIFGASNPNTNRADDAMKTHSFCENIEAVSIL